MKTRIFCPIYINITENVVKALNYFLNRLLKHIDARIKRVSVIDKRFIELDIEGSEADVASNFLRKTFGQPISSEDILLGNEYAGRIIRINDEEVLIDIGIIEGNSVRILKHIFVQSLLGIKKIKGDVNKLFNYMGISLFFPVQIIVKKRESRTFWGLPSRRTKILYKKWLDQRLDRVYVWGTLRSQLDKILRRSRLYKSVIRVERLGLLEHVILCRFGVWGDEVIRTLSKYGISGAIFMPRRLRKLIKELSR